VLKHRIAQIALVASLAGISAGCGASRPYKYFQLDVSAPTPAQAIPYPITILVGRVATPQLYRDSRIVYGSGPVQLGTYEYNRWAEMPSDMIQQALISALRGTGQYRSVTAVGSTSRGDFLLRSQLYSLYEVDQPQVAGRFSIQVELFDSKSGATVWSDTYSHDEPVEGKSVGDVVEAINRNVRAGMQQLTTHLGQYFAAHPPQPPAAQ
jgi:cholesterol transport system auxiliary component